MTFDSDAFKKNRPSLPLREFTVENPDFDNEMSSGPTNGPAYTPPHPVAEYVATKDKEQAQQRVADVNRARAEFAQQSNMGLKQRIEFLTNIGRQFRDVKVGDTTLTLRTLKSKEVDSCFKLAAVMSQKDETMTNTEVSFVFNRYRLATSLVKIDGQEIYFILGSNDIETKVKLLENFEQETYNYILSEFNKLIDDSKKMFEIKSDTDAKEVIETLKK